MGSRFPSHKLSSGLYVSGRPEQPKERTPTMSSVAMPYTGGDIKKSGELGKMFDIPVDGSKSRKSGPISGAPSRTGSISKKYQLTNKLKMKLNQTHTTLLSYKTTNIHNSNNGILVSTYI